MYNSPARKRRNIALVMLSLTVILSLFTQSFSIALATDDGGVTPTVTLGDEEESSAASTTASSPENAASSDAESSKADAKPDTSNLEGKLAQLQKESQAIQSQINATKKEKNQEQQTLNSITAKLANTQSQIDVIQSQINALEANIKKMDTEIETLNGTITEREAAIVIKQEEYNVSFDLFTDRLVAMYIAGEGNEIDAMFSADDYTTLVLYNEYLQYMADNDKAQMDALVALRQELEAEKALIESEKQTIETNRAEIVVQQEEQVAKRAEVQKAKNEQNALRQESQSIINSYDGDLQMAMQDLDKVAKEQKQIESEISALINNNTDVNSEYVGGDFLWPVPGFGKVTMGYGGYPGHTGMDITGGGGGAISNAKIVAANDGTVIAVKRGNTGYGYYLIIDHGGGRTTLYAHCASISVAVGQKVSRGEEIARVGSTGNSTGYHLHFEVRINGKAVNPAGYV